MTITKGVPTLEWWLTKWLHEHGFPTLTARMSDSFQYDRGRNELLFSLYVCETLDRQFLEFCQERVGFPYKCDVFLLSFFHELGHHVTLDDFSTEEVCKHLDWANDPNAELELDDYWGSDIEFAATAWGCCFICDHADEIQNFWRIFSKLANNVIRVNGMKGGEDIV